MLLMTLLMALFYSSVPVSHDSVTESQHEQQQGFGAEAANWISVIINFVGHTRAVPTAADQDVLCIIF